MKLNQERKIRGSKRALVGRIIYRLAGDRTGAVMMEYVILGVMIAGAVVVAATLFGKVLVAGFSDMCDRIMGKTKAPTIVNVQEGENSRKTATGGGENSGNTK